MSGPSRPPTSISPTPVTATPSTPTAPTPTAPTPATPTAPTTRPEPSAYWCELAWIPPGITPTANVLVRVDRDRIVGVEPDTPSPPPGAKTLRGLTLPGLANGHSHAFHRALRGRTHRASSEASSFWTWRTQMYDVADRLDPDSYLDLATATYAEMALAGVTCVGEFHYLHHDRQGRSYAEPNVMADALVAAARAAGLRIALLDACYLSGGIGLPLAGAQRRFGDGDVDRWADRVERLDHAYAAAADVVIGAAIHSVRAVPMDQLAGVVGWAAQRERPLHVHLSEQRRENDDCAAAYGVSPTRLLFDAGALSPRTTAVHATHLDGDGIGLLAGTGTTICLCPTTERDLADGIAPAATLDRAGSRLVLGTDSHAVIDMFEEARALEHHERLASGQRGHWSAAELLRAVTESGHHALGTDDAGVISAGARADLVCVRLDSVRTAGATPDQAADAAVFAATSSDVDVVVANGVLVVEDGRHRLLGDVAARLERTIRAL
ncbi:formimidoylglutamate deiminase [Actinopolymorpha sp. B17G11]|uniref:formimidoylglutamate deiminase n=1 Tax=Actinopolymorpha sp. B17G11 TaxID=3160861 RepID=UPI0032E4ECE4